MLFLVKWDYLTTSFNITIKWDFLTTSFNLTNDDNFFIRFWTHNTKNWREFGEILNPASPILAASFYRILVWQLPSMRLVVYWSKVSIYISFKMLNEIPNHQSCRNTRTTFSTVYLFMLVVPTYWESNIFEKIWNFIVITIVVTSLIKHLQMMMTMPSSWFLVFFLGMCFVHWHFFQFGNHMSSIMFY